MSPVKIVALLLLIAGALGLAYGGFSYTSDVHRADLGPVHLSVKEKEHVSIPVWAGLTAIAAGGLLLLVVLRRST